MKNTMKHYAGMSVALLILFTLVFPGSSMAANDKNDKKEPTSVIDLKFIGNVNDQPVFELNLQNTSEDEYAVIFRDNYGNILYSERIKGTSITKKFILNTEEIGDEPLNVIVKAKKLNRTETYSINRKYSYTEQAVVNKVN
jgi:hypothetical protein